MRIFAFFSGCVTESVRLELNSLERSFFFVFSCRILNLPRKVFTFEVVRAVKLTNVHALVYIPVIQICPFNHS